LDFAIDRAVSSFSPFAIFAPGFSPQERFQRFYHPVGKKIDGQADDIERHCHQRQWDRLHRIDVEAREQGHEPD